MSFRLSTFSNRILKSFLGLPAAVLLVSSPIKAEAATLTVDSVMFRGRTVDVSKDITGRNNRNSYRNNRYGIDVKQTEMLSFSPPKNDTWTFELDSTGRNRKVDFTVFQPNENQSWIFDLSVTKGTLDFVFLDNLGTGRNERDKTFSFSEVTTLRSSYRDLRIGDRSRTKFVSYGSFRIEGRGEGTLTATAVPEPFSTTAAVGLAIAGVTRTLKKKKTDDA